MVFVKTFIQKQEQWLIKMIHCNTPAQVWMCQHHLGITQKLINHKMFVRQNQNQFRNSNADVQIFYGSGTAGTSTCYKSWNKPIGVSHIYIMLIGGGGGGDGSNNGGGSGAVTVWYGAAQNVPNNLVILPSPASTAQQAGNASIVYYRGSSSTLVTLLSANGGGPGSNPPGGTAMTPNQFTASGFFQSVAGNGGGASTISASSTIFLTGGAVQGPSVGNYGYGAGGTGNVNGYFQLQPIIFGIGSSSSTTGGDSMNAGIGCGGGLGGLQGAPGGQGMILIASW